LREPAARRAGGEADKFFMSMNESRRRASDWVQGGVASVGRTITRAALPTVSCRGRDQSQEITMLKTLSAALLAVSMLAAPAMAAGVTPAKPTAPATAAIAKPDALKARAELVRPHHRLVRHHAMRHHVVRHHVVRHHHVHKRIVRHHAHHPAKLSVRPAHAAHRG
jgi:hypothetical protein